MAAPFCIGMLGWYAWYETDSKFWLFDLYFFVGAATLAKGPVASLSCAGDPDGLCRAAQEWSILRRSIWWPGVVLYLAMVLPWFIAVQKRNPNFLRVFFLEHNLERFATNRFEHEQHFWYYIPVIVLSLMPWAVIAIAALVSAVQGSIAEWRARRAKFHYMGHQRAGDAFPEFLVLWALIPVIFFSFSGIEAAGVCSAFGSTADDSVRRLSEPHARTRLKPWLLILHGVLAGGLTTLVLLLPRLIQHPDQMPPSNALIAAGTTGFAATLFILITVARFGIRRLRIATMIPIVILLLFLYALGRFFGFGEIKSTKGTVQLIDLTYSARPLAKILEQIAPPDGTVAVYKARRDMEIWTGLLSQSKSGELRAGWDPC